MIVMIGINVVEAEMTKTNEYQNGIELWNSEKYTAALKAFAKTVALNPYDIDCWFARGTLLMMDGKLREALKCYEKVIELNPAYNNYGAYFNKAFIFSTLSKYEEAISCYNAIIPQSKEVYLGKFETYKKWGKTEKARNSYEKMITMEPSWSLIW